MIVNVCASSRNSRESFCQVYYYLDEEQSAAVAASTPPSSQQSNNKSKTTSSSTLKSSKKHPKIEQDKPSLLKKLFVKMTSMRRGLI